VKLSRYITAALAASALAHSLRADSAPEKSLLRDPSMSLAAPGAQGAVGTWTGIGTGNGTFAFRKEGADLFCTATSVGPARLQFGTALQFNETNPPPPPGTLIWASVRVRGMVKALGDGGQGKSFAETLAPKRQPGTPEKPGNVIPSVGEIPWTKLEAVIPVALFATLTDDTAKKAACLAWITQWTDATLAWGKPETDLPHSQQMLALNAIYDWLKEDLSPDLPRGGKAFCKTQPGFSMRHRKSIPDCRAPSALKRTVFIMTVDHHLRRPRATA